jgi:hypothetical protein
MIIILTIDKLPIPPCADDFASLIHLTKKTQKNKKNTQK